MKLEKTDHVKKRVNMSNSSARAIEYLPNVNACEKCGGILILCTGDGILPKSALFRRLGGFLPSFYTRWSLECEKKYSISSAEPVVHILPDLPKLASDQLSSTYFVKYCHGRRQVPKQAGT
jgi:hypothetical protein